MYHDFDSMNASARIWIFQAKRPMPFEEVERLSARLMHFLDSWQAHGHDLQASFTIKYSRFVVVALDEASYKATGCSIDKLTHHIQALEKELGLSLLDRMEISYKEDGLVHSMPMAAFRNALEMGEFDAHTTVFNNLVETKGQLNSEWEVPLKDSWHKQLLPIA
jgi:hypothetical protein